MGALWQLQLVDLGLYDRMPVQSLLYSHNLVAVAIGMAKFANLDVALNLVGRQVDDSFVEIVLSCSSVLDSPPCSSTHSTEALMDRVLEHHYSQCP